MFELVKQKQVTMETRMVGTKNAQLAQRFANTSTAKVRETHSDAVLQGIELDLFSHVVKGYLYSKTIKEVVGEHFHVALANSISGTSLTFRISPKDYAKINGGMMYTSAGSIISGLISRGFLIQGYRTITNE